MPGESDARDDLTRETGRQFGLRADAYVASPTHAQGADLARLIELAGDLLGARALDVATGGGHTAAALRAAGALVVATDISVEMLRASIAAHGGPFVTAVAEAAHLPFPDRTFDVVSCRIALHHFPDPAGAFREWARILRTGGRLLFIDSFVPAEPEIDALLNEIERRRDYTHRRSYTERELCSMARDAGFQVETCEQILKRHDLEEWLARGAMRDRVADAEAIRSMLSGALPGVQEAVDLRWLHGVPAGIADLKLLIAARNGAG